MESHMKHVGNPTYRSWAAMRGRCLRPQKKDMKAYKGISITPKWGTFDGFLEDMGKRPKGKSLERIDNTKGYSKENCKWATATEQVRNRRNTIRVTFKGVKKTLFEHCEDQGIRYGLVHRRVFSQGWRLEYALTVPPLPRGESRVKVDRKFFMCP